MPNVSAIAGGSLSIMCPVGGWPIEQILWLQSECYSSVSKQQQLQHSSLVPP